MSLALYTGYLHTPTLEDVVATDAHKWFKSRLLRREARTYRELEAIALQRRWRFVANSYAFKARVLEAHADFLAPF